MASCNRLMALTEEKQSVMEQIGQLQQAQTQQATLASRMEEQRKWLAHQTTVFTEYVKVDGLLPLNCVLEKNLKIILTQRQKDGIAQMLTRCQVK